MALILSKSPYHIGRKDLVPNASLKVTIGVFEFDFAGNNSFRALDTYDFAYRNKTHIDISQVVHDTQDTYYTFLTSTNSYFAQDFSNNSLIVETQLSGFKDVNGVLTATTYAETFQALRGYVYSSDIYNYDATPDLAKNSYYAGSSDIVYKLDDSNLELPFVNPTSSDNPYENLNYDTYVVVNAFNKGELIDSKYLYFSGGAVYQKYTTNHFASFTERINSEGAELEQNKCLTDFFDCHRIADIDKITISSSDNTPIKTLEVRTVEEKKYNPYRLSFKNRFGVWENLWFFKKSTEQIKVSRSEFRANQFQARVNARELNIGYNDTPVVRQSQQYNTNGITELTLNSGFVDESLNESFKQLLLSEEVVLYNFNEGSYEAVTVTNTDLEFKTSTNDKLINYEIKVKMANNMIDDIT